MPDVEVHISPSQEQEKSERWWPVVILNFKEDAKTIFPQLDDSEVIYVICIYQMLEKDIAAWSVRRTNKLQLEATRVVNTGSR